MCGLFGWSGLKPGVFNRDKFDKLGIFNEKRGTHSCGVSIDGEIYSGVDGSKIYRDFIVNNYDIKDPVVIPSVLGHTRLATVGVHNAANAHPFGFGSLESGEFEFVGIHNGSLLNHRDLAKKYDVELEDKEPGKKWGRDKIDSEILLEILYKTRNFKVLSQYNGAAALVWSFLEDPDVVYYYHGKSKVKEHDKDSAEERPLYYYKKGTNDLYFSSIEDSLVSIGANLDDDTLGEFEHNTVYKVVNGDIDTAKKFKISRVNNYQKHGGVAPKKDTATPETTGNSTGKTRLITEGTKSHNCKIGSGGVNRNFVESKNIYDEVPEKDVNDYKGKVYINKLRYWRNGHRITGLFTFVSGFGLYELGQNLKEAEAKFWKIVGQVFINGEFKSLTELDDKELQSGYIPFKNTKETPITNPPIIVLFDGVILPKWTDLQGCLAMEAAGKAFDALSLSLIAQHPIIDLTYSRHSKHDQRIYYQGEKYTGMITPIGSEREYNIKDGNLIDYTTLVKTKDLIKEVDKLEKAEETKFLEGDADGKNFVADDFMTNYLRKIFDGPLNNMKYHKHQLKSYLPNMAAQRGMKIIEYFENSVHNLLEIEEKE